MASTKEAHATKEERDDLFRVLKQNKANKVR